MLLHGKLISSRLIIYDSYNCINDNNAVYALSKKK